MKSDFEKKLSEYQRETLKVQEQLSNLKVNHEIVVNKIKEEYANDFLK